MGNLGYHLRLRFVDDRIFAGNRAERCVLASAVHRADRSRRVLAFRAADMHLHFEVLSGEEECRQFARQVAIALQARLRYGVPFGPPRLKPLADMFHLGNTFHYILDQERHHGIRPDPLHEASNLPDLLGLRVWGQGSSRLLASVLPRVGGQELLEHLGVPDLAPAAIEPRYLLSSAAAAFGMMRLSRNTPVSRQARAAAVKVARSFLGVRESAHRLGLDERSIRRLACFDVPDFWIEAVRRQVALRVRLTEKGLDVSALDSGEPSPLAVGCSSPPSRRTA